MTGPNETKAKWERWQTEAAICQKCTLPIEDCDKGKCELQSKDTRKRNPIEMPVFDRPPPGYISIRQAAELCNRSQGDLRDRIERGQLDPIRSEVTTLEGRYKRIPMVRQTIFVSEASIRALPPKQKYNRGV